MHTRIAITRWCIVLFLLIAPSAARAEDAAPAYWAAVTADDVYLRCAPSVESSYPFSTLKPGALLRVTEESFGWARVQAVGPAFKDLYALVHSRPGTRLSADGKHLEISERTELFAPNASAHGDPEGSYRSIARASSGDTLTVLDKVEDRKGDVYYKVPLPPTAEGWVNMAFMCRATAEEVRTLEGKVPAELLTQPAAPKAASADSGKGKSGESGSKTGEAKSDTSKPEATKPEAAGAGQGGTEKTTPPAPGDGSAGEGAATDKPATDESKTTAPGDGGEGAPDKSDAVQEAVAKVRKVTLEDLEASLKTLQREPLETAEVEPLRLRYIEFADRPDTSSSMRTIASGRAEQLALRAEVQENILKLRALQARTTQEKLEIETVRVAMESRRDYIAAGRLNASSIYDGIRLPLLYRLTDVTGGHTIAYLTESKAFSLAPLVGQLVGVVGDRSYDDSLRLNIIAPLRIDILTAP